MRLLFQGWENQSWEEWEISTKATQLPLNSRAGISPKLELLENLGGWLPHSTSQSEPLETVMGVDGLGVCCLLLVLRLQVWVQDRTLVAEPNVWSKTPCLKRLLDEPAHKAGDGWASGSVQWLCATWWQFSRLLTIYTVYWSSPRLLVAWDKIPPWCSLGRTQGIYQKNTDLGHITNHRTDTEIIEPWKLWEPEAYMSLKCLPTPYPSSFLPSDWYPAVTATLRDWFTFSPVPTQKSLR